LNAPNFPGLKDSFTIFNGLCAVGFLARASYPLARTPGLALFAIIAGILILAALAFRAGVRG